MSEKPQVPARFFEIYGREAMERRLLAEQSNAQAEQIKSLQQQVEELESQKGREDGRDA